VTGHDLRSRSDAVSLIEDIEASQWPKEAAAKKETKGPKENPPAPDAAANRSDRPSRSGSSGGSGGEQ
jgi:hypothetical protein